eukprot:TRINITY_DN20347_c1_g1_i1.p1 TRINITY_DN20347_c1_g1~~TRINITY_DN20347_c1_g1_i1.p1  ORF type:complete len:1386 (-),score=328.48 TRINITY_DN20347_c1_g1_i1:53-4210(-)
MASGGSSGSSSQLDWVVAIPSFDRVNTLPKRTLRLLASCVPKSRVYVFADPTQIGEYEKGLRGCGVHVLPGARGICEQRNAIMRHFPPGSRVVEMDDDIEKLELNTNSLYKEHGKASKLIDIPDKGVAGLFQFLWQVADREGCSCWGIYPARNAFMMSHTYTVGLAKCTGQVMGYINPAQCLQLTMPVMEDYERCLAMFVSGQRILRANFVAARTKNHGVGGCQSAFHGETAVTLDKDGQKVREHQRAAKEAATADALKRTYPELVTSALAPKPIKKVVPEHGEITIRPPGWRVTFARSQCARRDAQEVVGELAERLGLGGKIVAPPVQAMAPMTPPGGMPSGRYFDDSGDEMEGDESDGAEARLSDDDNEFEAAEAVAAHDDDVEAADASIAAAAGDGAAAAAAADADAGEAALPGQELGMFNSEFEDELKRQLHQTPKRDLHVMCLEAGLLTSGKKEDLIKRLVDLQTHSQLKEEGAEQNFAENLVYPKKRGRKPKQSVSASGESGPSTAVAAVPAEEAPAPAAAPAEAAAAPAMMPPASSDAATAGAAAAAPESTGDVGAAQEDRALQCVFCGRVCGNRGWKTRHERNCKLGGAAAKASDPEALEPANAASSEDILPDLGISDAPPAKRGRHSAGAAKATMDQLAPPTPPAASAPATPPAAAAPRGQGSKVAGRRELQATADPAPPTPPAAAARPERGGPAPATPPAGQRIAARRGVQSAEQAPPTPSAAAAAAPATPPAAPLASSAPVAPRAKASAATRNAGKKKTPMLRRTAKMVKANAAPSAAPPSRASAKAAAAAAKEKAKTPKAGKAAKAVKGVKARRENRARKEGDKKKAPAPSSARAAPSAPTSTTTQELAELLAAERRERFELQERYEFELGRRQREASEPPSSAPHESATTHATPSVASSRLLPPWADSAVGTAPTASSSSSASVAPAPPVPTSFSTPGPSSAAAAAVPSSAAGVAAAAAAWDRPSMREQRPNVQQRPAVREQYEHEMARRDWEAYANSSGIASRELWRANRGAVAPEAEARGAPGVVETITVDDEGFSAPARAAAAPAVASRPPPQMQLQEGRVAHLGPPGLEPTVLSPKAAAPVDDGSLSALRRHLRSAFSFGPEAPPLGKAAHRLHPNASFVLNSWRVDPAWRPPPMPHQLVRGSHSSGLGAEPPTYEAEPGTVEAPTLEAPVLQQGRGAAPAFMSLLEEDASGLMSPTLASAVLPDERCIFWITCGDSSQRGFALVLWDSKPDDTLFDCGRAALAVFCDPLSVPIADEEDNELPVEVEEALRTHVGSGGYPASALSIHEGCTAIGMAAGRERRRRAVWLSLAVSIAIRRGEVDVLDKGLRRACSKMGLPEDELPNIHALCHLAAKAGIATAGAVGSQVL